MDVLAAQQPSGVDAEDVFDARYEYSAPRFYDFEKGSPDDEDEPDEWFGTAATTGKEAGGPGCMRPALNRLLRSRSPRPTTHCAQP
jgi:hypothetical protein